MVANPVSGQYGQLSGAQVTYVTKSGTNTYHGNAAYWWNGRLLNANNWMNKQGQADAHALDPSQPANQAPFSNANQWAASFGGPIIKNKTFFFVDYEGLRFVLPNVDTVTTPTAAFANAAMANVAATQQNSSAMFNTMMDLWLNAPGASSAAPYAPAGPDPSSGFPGILATSLVQPADWALGIRQIPLPARRRT